MHGYCDIEDGEQAHADRATLLRLLDAAREDVKRLEAALKPFAVFSECFTDVSHDDAVGARFSTTTISVGAFRHASAALKGT
jgi:hypothetical protein